MNPAEKIRQVVEGHIEALDGIELYKGSKRTSMCLVSTAKQSMLYMAESILDALILQREEYRADLPSSEYQKDNYYAARDDEAYDTVEWLREIRTSLTTTL